MVARAIRPDNLAEIETEVSDDHVETTIDRPRTGSLHATIDDYLVNLIVADALHERIETETMTSTEPTETDQ